MSCGCTSNNTMVRSFNDLQQLDPVDPRSIIDYVAIDDAGVQPGVWTLSSNYAVPTPPSVWGATAIGLNGLVTIETNHTDNDQMVFDAAAYTQANQQSTNTSSSVAMPLRKIAFCRAGRQWLNDIPLVFPASPQIVEVQLSLLENAATRGDNAGTIPVFRFAATPFSTTPNLRIVFKRPGRFVLGLLTINNAGTPGYALFELDAIVV